MFIMNHDCGLKNKNMIRIPKPSSALSEYLGRTISEEALKGRGYFYAENGNVLIDDNPKIADISYYMEDDSENDDSITCRRVKEYLAESIEDYFVSSWVKGIPANPEDVDNQEVYMVICIEVIKRETGYEVADIHVLARFVEQVGGGWFTIPGASSLESNYFEMELLPPEVFDEINMLLEGRFLPEGFSLEGKPMPKNKDNFHQNPPYSMALNSGWRNIYWHLSLDVDDNDIIDSLEISTYERETSMFQRPHLMDDDPCDSFDCILRVIDQYSNEEWSKIR